MFLTAVIVLIGPVVFWTGYIYYQDRYGPEPLTRVGLAYLLGLVAAVLCNEAYDLLPLLGVTPDPMALVDDGNNGFLPYALGVIGPLEEGFKMIPFLLVCTRLRAFNEPLDGIVYASMIGLGFASVETFHSLEVLEGGQLYGHALTLPIVHALFASVWGYAYARARFSGGSTTMAVAFGFVLSACLHGLYDFVVINPMLVPVGALGILALWLIVLRVSHHLRLASVAALQLAARQD